MSLNHRLWWVGNTLKDMRFRSWRLLLRSLDFILYPGHGKPSKNIKQKRDIIWVTLGKFLNPSIAVSLSEI